MLLNICNNYSKNLALYPLQQWFILSIWFSETQYHLLKFKNRRTYLRHHSAYIKSCLSDRTTVQSTCILGSVFSGEFYAAKNGSFLPTFRDNLSVPSPRDYPWRWGQ